MQGLSSDGQVIARLQAAGSDVSRPHSVDFFLYFPNEAAAGRISHELAGQNYNTSVEANDEGTQWLILARKELVPTEAALAKIRNELTVLASTEGGEYDGWGAAVVRQILIQVEGDP